MNNSQKGKGLKQLLVLWTVPLLFLLLFFFYPLGAIFNLAGSAVLEEGVMKDLELYLRSALESKPLNPEIMLSYTGVPAMACNRKPLSINGKGKR